MSAKYCKEVFGVNKLNMCTSQNRSNAPSNHDEPVSCDQFYFYLFLVNINMLNEPTHVMLEVVVVWKSELRWAGIMVNIFFKSKKSHYHLYQGIHLLPLL